jgi:DNA-binding transcriptional LysR family regulator
LILQTQLLDWLGRGVVDIIVTDDLGPSFGESVSRICKAPTHALVSREDPLAQRDSISLLDLVERPLVLLDPPQTSTYLLTLFDLVGVKPRVGFRTRSYETVRSAVASGFGAAVLNMKPIGRSNPDSPVLARVPLSDDLPAPTLLNADLYGAMKPRGVRRLIDIFVSLFRNLDPHDFAVVTLARKHILFEV